jgi:hypothetical protein
VIKTNLSPRGDTVLRSVLHLADMAPNAGGYRWELSDDAAHLHLSDPASGHDVLLGAGAVLHHLRVALAAAGWGAVVNRGPTTAAPTLLATVRAVSAQPTGEQVAMAAAISTRRADSGDYSEAAVPWTVLDRLSSQAKAERAELHLVLDYEMRMRMLKRARSLRNAGVLAVLATPEAENAQFRAGEAMSAVLLMGTAWGLLGCRLVTDQRLAEQIVGTDGVPRAVLRLGYPRT